jgi:hypothetical protein
VNRKPTALFPGWLLPLPLALVLAAGCYNPYYTQPARSQAAYTPPSPSAEVVLAGGEGTEVVVEGAAALPQSGGTDIARDHALKDALRKAVEQGVGTFINSETKVQNFQLLSDKVYSQSSGYVSSYKVIAEGLDGTLYRVTIRARVKLDRLQDDLEAIGILVMEQGRPRIMVVVKELTSQDVSVSDDMLSQEMVETMLVDAFQSRGFPVVDAATVSQNLKKDQLKKILEGDDRTAVLLGLKTGAEIVVAGTARRSTERKSAPYSGGLTDFYKYRLVTRAVNVATAEILGASALTREVPFSEEQARQQAADSAGTALIARILAGWKKRTNVTQIYCDNADFQKVQQLKSEIIGRVRGVTSVVSRDLVGSTATLEVISESGSQEILDDLTTRGITIPFEVKGLSGNRIDIRFK